jgi:hypothetical protein
MHTSATWGNHINIFKKCGLTVRKYRYYDRSRNAFDLEGMVQDLQRARDGSVILLHACGHNRKFSTFCTVGGDIAVCVSVHRAMRFGRRYSITLNNRCFVLMLSNLASDIVRFLPPHWILWPPRPPHA